jgi:hypothetical protein
VQRRLVKKPLFVASVLATLTVGLGAFAVVYTAVDKILLEPLPYRAPGDLYMVWFNQSVDLPHLMVTGPQIVELRKAGGVIADAAGLTFNGATLMAGDERAERVDALLGSENLFDLLGVEPALGRTFRPGDGTGDAERVVVLTDDLWRRLGANRGIVGTTLTLSSKAYTVIAVMPPGFRFSASSSARKPQLYIPFEFGRLAREDPQVQLVDDRARAGRSIGTASTAGRRRDRTCRRPARLRQAARLARGRRPPAGTGERYPPRSDHAGIRSGVPDACVGCKPRVAVVVARRGA